MPKPRRGGRASGAVAAWIVRLRWLIVLGWLALAATATLLLPSATSVADRGFAGLVPEQSPAVQAAQRSFAQFSFPLLSNTMVVVRRPAGLSVYTQADVVLRALAIDQRLVGLTQPLPKDRILGALPVLNDGRLFPGSAESGTTALTYLYFNPATSLNERDRLARDYADALRAVNPEPVYVTGTVPARVAEQGYLTSHLRTLEIATLAMVFLIVGVTFRSLIAPLLALGSAVLAFLITLRVLGGLGTLTGFALPAELEPLVIALLLGVLTDYAVFFVSGLRVRLAAGADRQEATRGSIEENLSIVFVAGLTVAAGTAALYASKLELFRVFGPGLAITVLTGLAVAVTLLPALLAILGRRVFWPSAPRPRRRGQHAVAVRERSRRARSVGIRALVRRPIAALVGVACIGVLLAASAPLLHSHLELSFIRGLPDDAPAARGAAAATQGFADGIVGQTVLLVDGHGVTDERAALTRLEDLLDRQAGVAGVLGPAENPLPEAHGVFLSADGQTARYLLTLDSDPLGHRAIATLRTLRAQLPALLARAGLPRASVGLTGDTAIAAEVVTATRVNLRRIVLAAFAVELVILALYLRALVAPLFLLASSALVVGAAEGVTTWLFQDHLQYGGLTFFAPFATAVLLIALGSDYNVFGVGRVWEEADRRPWRDALEVAVPASSKAITTAGLTLAASFALVALIPLVAFREMAFTMAVGLLLDTFLVRSVLNPGAAERGRTGESVARSPRDAPARR